MRGTLPRKYLEYRIVPRGRQINAGRSLKLERSALAADSRSAQGFSECGEFSPLWDFLDCPAGRLPRGYTLSQDTSTIQKIQKRPELSALQIVFGVRGVLTALGFFGLPGSAFVGRPEAVPGLVHNPKNPKAVRTPRTPKTSAEGGKKQKSWLDERPWRFEIAASYVSTDLVVTLVRVGAVEGWVGRGGIVHDDAVQQRDRPDVIEDAAAGRAGRVVDDGVAHQVGNDVGIDVEPAAVGGGPVVGPPVRREIESASRAHGDITHQ